MNVVRVAVGAVAAAALVVPQAQGVEAVPLPKPSGVVVTWNAKSLANVVVTSNNRVYVIHSLRRYRSGTRVRIRGIKWGRVGFGIRWGYRPRGIKWGILFARNGTFAAGLTPVGRTRRIQLRGTVVRRYRSGVGISVNGATFALRTVRSTKWLRTSQTASGPVGDVGSVVQFSILVTRSRRPVIVRAREIRSARPWAALPYAGIVTAVDPLLGTVTVNATSDPTMPLTFTLTVPIGVDLATIKRGRRISGTARTSPTGGTDLFVTRISNNSSFAAADNPATTLTVPAPSGALLAEIHQLRLLWESGRTNGGFTDEGNGVSRSGGAQLANAERAIMRTDVATAADTVTQFIGIVQNANLPASAPATMTEAFQATVLEAAQHMHAALAQELAALAALAQNAAASPTETLPPAAGDATETVDGVNSKAGKCTEHAKVLAGSAKAGCAPLE